MIQEQEFKEYIDLFYSGINKCRKEHGLDILSEDQCIPNQMLELILKGQSKEQEDKRAIYKRCQLFCDENDLLFNKQHLQMNSYSANRQEVEEGIRFIFNQIYQDNEKEIQSNRKLTHMKIFMLKTHTDMLRSCLALSAKPLQIIEFSYDTMLDSYIVSGKLNKSISKEPINLYAIKIIDSYNMKDVIIGPGRGQIDEKLNFNFKIPQGLLKDVGIQPSNNRCELEFYHKIEAEITHYQHFAFTSVDIDHTYSLIMKQAFFPVQNGRLTTRKARKDSPDIRRSNSLFKNRLSSSCNKENRLPQGYDHRQYSASQNENNGMQDQAFNQQNNQGYNYYSEKRNNGRQSQFMDSIWEANEKDFSIYKDDMFRSENRRGNPNSQSQNKQIFSFGENDVPFFRDNNMANRQTPYSKPYDYEDKSIFGDKKDIFNTSKSSFQQQQQQVSNNKQPLINLFQNPQNDIFKQQSFPSVNSQLPGVNSSLASIQNVQNPFFPNNNNNSNKASNIFSNVSNSSNINIFANPSTQDKNLFSLNNHNNINNPNIKNNTSIINKENDIWNTNQRDLFQNQGKPDNKSLQNPVLLSTNLYQPNNNNNNNNNSINNNNNNSTQNVFNTAQVFQTQQIQQQQHIPSDPQNIFQNSQAQNIQNANKQMIAPLPSNTIDTNTQNLQQYSLNQTSIIPLLNNSINDNKIPIVQQTIIQQSHPTGLQNGSIQGNQIDYPFSQSERHYYKGVKHTFTQYENLAKPQKGQEHKIPSNKLRKQKVMLDSRNYKDPVKKIQKLKEIEKGYKCCQEPLKSDYQKYWNTGEHCDFTLSLEQDSEAFFRLHKVVVGHYSEYFRKIFSEQKITHFTLKQNNYNSEAVRLMFKWMYFNELPNHEWDEMSFKQAQQTLNCALFTKTWEFLVQVIIKVIIPKMTSEKLIDFLILSEYLPAYFASRKDDESLSLLFGVLKLLQNYCILFFSNNSVEVIEKTEDVKIQQLIELNSDLIFTLVNEASLKFDTLEHLEKLFGWLNKQAPMYFGRNIVELCSFFESQYLDIQPFDKIYMSFEKEIKSLKSQYAFTTPFFDKTPNIMAQTPSKSNKKKQNDEMCDETDIIFTEIEDILLSKREWPSSNLLKPSLKEEQSKARDILFSRSSDFTFQFKRPDIPTVFISEEFYSFSRQWRIILIIDSGEDQKESGQRSQKELEVSLYNERILFTSALVRVEFQERKSCSFDMFYSFANNQNMAIGRQKFCQAKRIADPSSHNIKIKVWIEELKCHSGLMHFISQQITDFLVLGFNEDQKKIAVNEVEQSNKKHMVNNEPVSNRRQSHRIMDALLDKEWSKITAQMDEEGKILSPIKSRMSVNRVAKENFSSKAKELNFFSLPVFEAYYILSSDNLNINHEKYAVHLIYRLSLNKSDIEIDLILHGIRFSYLELDQMLNLARDHNAIKRNKHFQMMIKKEINSRFEMYQSKIVPLQKGRNHYDYAQFYKNQKTDFKQNFLEWLFNQEHHPGFKSEIQKIQNAIKSQMEELKQKENEINHQFMKLKQEQMNIKVKQYYPQQIAQNIPVISTISTNPSMNSQTINSIGSSHGSFEDNLQRRVQPSHIQMEPRIIYSSTGQPLLNMSQQDKQKMKGAMDFSQSSMPYISSSRSIEKDNCTIF